MEERKRDDLAFLWAKAQKLRDEGLAVTDLDDFFAIFQAVADGESWLSVVESRILDGQSGLLQHIIEWQQADGSQRFHVYTYGSLAEELATRGIPYPKP